MAKLYGERWKNKGPFTESGQAILYFVEDLTGECAGRLVLKRVRNPKRRDRFLAEVEASVRLRHQNIVPILDHSDLAMVENSSPSYLVMPFAQGGDLEHRSKKYAGEIEKTLLVTRQIADALLHAHSRDVIHRDVKPANILFQDEKSDHVLLADFGICLIKDTERCTPDGEVVGPWAFMAPELEAGGQLDVTPSADVYSLGKVIYFLLSGGVVLPREQQREERYDLFSKQEDYRWKLAELLLDEMICEKRRRIQEMGEVLRRLDQILSWGTGPTRNLLSGTTRESLNRLHDREREKRLAEAQRANSAKADRDEFERYLSGVSSWLALALEGIAEDLNAGGLFRWEVFACSREVEIPFFNRHDERGNRLVASQALGLRLDRNDLDPGCSECLLFTLFFRQVVRIVYGDREPLPLAEQRVVFLPNWTRRDQVERDQGYVLRRGYYAPDGRPLVDRFPGGGRAIFLETRPSEWPTNQEAYAKVVRDTIEVILDGGVVG